mmetsp:Transcript_20601/g.50545  ORF Transcript_20601/g.50545 Transcript_20601/m.50545 type:complete len:108 (+) Transcript_20601:4776-5099(+)
MPSTLLFGNVLRAIVSPSHLAQSTNSSSRGFAPMGSGHVPMKVVSFCVHPVMALENAPKPNTTALSDANFAEMPQSWSLKSGGSQRKSVNILQVRTLKEFLYFRISL